jgi:TRAP-type C4-dicarboxylate transport system permease small subunit
MWIDPLVRHLVFLATFLGGAVATGRGTHIAIDLVSKILEVKEWHHIQVWISRIIYLFSSLILIWLFKASIDFTKVEFEFAKIEFLGISSGYLVAIIPFGVILISFRFFVLFLKSFSKEVRT